MNRAGSRLRCAVFGLTKGPWLVVGERAWTLSSDAVVDEVAGCTKTFECCWIPFGKLRAGAPTA